MTDIQDLAARYGVPNEVKLERRLQRLERMISFYQSKVDMPDIPEKQANMFKGFISSLQYAITMIKMHRSLTKELAEEATNENRTDSQS